MVLAVLSRSSQQEKADFILTLFEEDERMNIDEVVLDRIFEPLINLAIHVIPGLSMRRIRKDSSSRLNTSNLSSSCCGVRDSADSKRPDLEVFVAFTSELARTERRVQFSIAEKM